MNWIDFYYPNKLFIVEVKYSGDIAIAEIRCKEEPEGKDNRYGFTKNFLTYETAKKAAMKISQELEIPFPGGWTKNNKSKYLIDT